ncbi:hypothetical protein GLOIN_2v1483717 [Rhizophagus clarus]|uniref:Uncharacterized protein n=1 Tax=Rhizophagus clarus TaxID=94130 RepID=A0A8H3KUE2_9GLOM|nr:hypothetical protein GLOIN_2v1483717 [Rhizophagus clarus]
MITTDKGLSKRLEADVVKVDDQQVGKMFIYSGVPMITKLDDYGVSRVDNNKLVNRDAYGASLKEAFKTALDISLIKENDIIIRKDIRQGKIEGVPFDDFGESRRRGKD